MPGADMFLVIRSAVNEGKKYAYFASLGIVAGTIVWLIVGFFFIQVLSKTSFFEIVRVAGGCYLIFMAWQIFRSLKKKNRNALQGDEKPKSTAWKNFLYGLFTNLSNPKPPIFVGIILSKIPQTLSFEHALILLCVMILIPSFWFPFVVKMFSIERFFRIFMRYARGIDCAVILIFGLFGLSLIVDGVKSLLG